jgi:hypothetical protein
MNSIKKIGPGRLMFFLVSLMAVLSLFSCDKELDIQTDFPFELEIMPVPDHTEKEQPVEILCSIKKKGAYNGIKYTIRYFQSVGDGALMFPNGRPFKPNYSYPLPEENFTLHYRTTSKDKIEFQIWVADNFGNEQTTEFSFN